ncbi:MAG: ABC transporter substrate-binding protein [Flavobacterium sp. BFFFF1]|uniref:ABC transporter substrate-binding protein n=1 Tax=Flavobacterium sp. BFFFF1 TaxID=2015557 RepID=UPI000BD5AF68|nr:ABC transporter substrate-binding protein [Flavobacterium sp. BFFFF1]OYU80569.1 MAG: ABC transporter substrate-binding protein [Flavobacterium sp. BFFFF1]
MKSFVKGCLTLTLLLLMAGCNNQRHQNAIPSGQSKNTIRYAKGLAIYQYDGFSVVRVSNPWPKATKAYTYVLHSKNATIPDSLKQYSKIQVPIKSIVVTSTTHVPSLEILGVQNTLSGFPNLDYISSPKIRKRIEDGKIKELGSNQNLNTEVLIGLAPDVIIGYGIDNNNPTLDNLQRSGLKVLLDGDWNEQTPLGKAEWIKLFGALYGLDAKANQVFSVIENDYNATTKLVRKAALKPTVLAGAVYENQWYLPEGNSWGAQFIKQAGGNYLWGNSPGTGSLSLPFEIVYEKGQKADYWIGPGQFISLKEMAAANGNYTAFDSYKNRRIYSFSSKKGKTGGVIFYELAPNRPDLVLKDMVKILHPELLPDYTLYFFEQLQ